MARKRWELEAVDVTPKKDGGWELPGKATRLMSDGWEPFEVTLVSVYHPEEPQPMDLLRERIWFRREVR